MITEAKECVRCGGKIERNEKQFDCHWAQVKYCPGCKKIKQREQVIGWIHSHPEKVMAFRRKRRLKNMQYQRIYYQQNKERLQELGRKYYHAHKEELAQYGRQHRQRMSELQKRYREKHKEELRAYFREYYLKHKTSKNLRKLQKN